MSGAAAQAVPRRRWYRRPWRQWSIRSRMVLSVAALAAVALVASNVAAVFLLRSYLLQRVDDQLHAQSRRPGAAFPELPPQPSVSGSGSAAAQAPEYRFRPPVFGPDFRVYRYDTAGHRTGVGRGTDQEGGPDLDALGDLRQHSADRRPTTVGGTGSAWRVRVTPLPNGQGYTVTAVSLREVEATEDWFLLIDVAVSALVLLLMGAAAATVVRIGLRPLTRMQDTAAAIADGDLSRRITDADPHTESGQLGTALNTMLGRIEAAVAERAASERRLRRLLADAAHELRTPLTSIQGFAELYRRGGARPGPQLDEAMGRVESEASRLRLLVNDLLLLARLDEERTLERRPVDLLAVAADSIRDAHVRVPSRFVGLAGFDDDCETFEPVTVLADEARIRQVVTNLVANALQHTPDDAAIVVRVGRAPATPGKAPHEDAAPGEALREGAPPGEALKEGTAPGEAPVVTIGADPPAGRALAAIEVGDTGPGMTCDDAQRVFERLYRADPSRSRRHGGAGLGLAIVLAIVKMHGGRIELRTAPGAGARFRVLLPARPSAPEDD